MKDYRLVKEKLSFLVLVYTVINFIFIVPLFIWVGLTEGIHDMDTMDNRAIIVWELVLMCPQIYCISHRIRRYLFLKKGVPYKGKVIEYSTYHKPKETRYYVYVQLIYEKQRKIIKSDAFNQSPKDVLRSNKCTVFVRKGKFYPCLFDYSRKRKDKKIDLPYKYIEENKTKAKIK